VKILRALFSRGIAMFGTLDRKIILGAMMGYILARWYRIILEE